MKQGQIVLLEAEMLKGAEEFLGIVIEDARPYHEPGWVTFSDNVLDLQLSTPRELGGADLESSGFHAKRLFH